MYKNYSIYKLRMFYNKKMKKIEVLINRMKEGLPISLEERIFLQKEAESDHSIYFSLQMAQTSLRHKDSQSDCISMLLQSLNPDSLNIENHFNPNHENIEDWFMGTPKWLRRS